MLTCFIYSSLYRNFAVLYAESSVNARQFRRCARTSVRSSPLYQTAAFMDAYKGTPNKMSATRVNCFFGLSSLTSTVHIPPGFLLWPRYVTFTLFLVCFTFVEVKQSHYRPGQALPGGWDFPISRQSALEGGKVASHTHRSLLPPRKYSWYSFLLEAESTSGSQCDRKDYVSEKFQWHHRESNPRPSSL
jgi:hypothetical protein